MKLAKQTTKKTSKKANAKVWAVRGMAILLAVLFVLGGLATILPTVF